MAMKEYHKIKWIFSFDAKTKKPTQYIVEYFQPMIEWKRTFTEKIDWTNIRVHRNWHKVLFWWRTENSQIPTRLISKLQEIFVEEIFEQHFWSKEVTLYWEWFWWKIQFGTRDYKPEEDFVLFDVMIWDIWLERENIEWIANLLWINTVPIVLEGTLQQWIDYVKNNYVWIPSHQKQTEWLIWVPVWWYRDRLWERIIVKIKKDHFLE